MAHYAFLNEDNEVLEVIVGKDENHPVPTPHASWEDYYASIKGKTCKRCSYNTRGGEHSLGGTPFRKNYPGPDYTYDETRDAFVGPKYFESWVLNEETCGYEAPLPLPDDANEDNQYIWDEDLYQSDNTQGWVQK
tara:strand:+ start:212 stop:616 length:405 start_codon:yes stop_codon:yes gene_type:complete